LERVESIDDTDQIRIIKTIELLVSNRDKDVFLTISNILLSGEFEENSLLHTICCEYCLYAVSQLVRLNALKDLKHIARLYEYGLHSGVLLTEGKLTRIRFYSMISALSNVYSFNEMNMFIEKWIHVVNSKIPSTVLKIAQAQNCFYHGQYGEILNSLRGSKFEDKYQRLRIIRFELVAMYEEGECDLLNTSIHNSMRVLNRNKREISTMAYTVNKNLIKILNYLMKNEISAIKYLLESNEPLIFREWIKEKINIKDEPINAHPSSNN